MDLVLRRLLVLVHTLRLWRLSRLFSSLLLMRLLAILRWMVDLLVYLAEVWPLLPRLKGELTGHVGE